MKKSPKNKGSGRVWRTWTAEEVEVLQQQQAGLLSPEEALSKLPGRSARGVREKLSDLKKGSLRISRPQRNRTEADEAEDVLFKRVNYEKDAERGSRLLLEACMRFYHERNKRIRAMEREQCSA